MRMLSLRVDEEAVRRLDGLAQEAGIGRSELLRRLIRGAGSSVNEHPREVLARHRLEVTALCRGFGVTHVWIVGSAARGDFDLDRSDLDLMLEWAPESDLGSLDRHLGFQAAIERLVGRTVDLIDRLAIENPYLLRYLDRDRVELV